MLLGEFCGCCMPASLPLPPLPFPPRFPYRSPASPGSRRGPFTGLPAEALSSPFPFPPPAAAGSAPRGSRTLGGA